jgi:probable RNA-binding protein EIF1AD
MSRVTKLKHVKREIEADDLSLPNEKQQIVRVHSSKGNNLHEGNQEKYFNFEGTLNLHFTNFCS